MFSATLSLDFQDLLAGLDQRFFKTANLLSHFVPAESHAGR